MNKLTSIFTSLFLLFSEFASANNSGRRTPPEAVTLKLPPDNKMEWKEISKNISEKDVTVEWVPSAQSASNWTQLIAIQYYDKTVLDWKVKNSVEKIVDQILMKIVTSYPSGRATCNVIQKNKNEIIYEWILHKPYNGIPPQHEIAKGILTEKGFHRVGFTRKNYKMGNDEREKWLKLLKESVMIAASGTALEGNEFLSIFSRKEN